MQLSRRKVYLNRFLFANFDRLIGDCHVTKDVNENDGSLDLRNIPPTRTVRLLRKANRAGGIDFGAVSCQRLVFHRLP